MIQVRVLGDLDVRSGAISAHDGGGLDDSARRPVVPLPARLQRKLLAALTIRGGRTCSRDHLIDVLWGDSPPPSAVKVLQTYVSSLRHLLGDELRILTVGSAYRLEGDLPASVDAVRFERLLRDARSAAGRDDWGTADRLLNASLALWRGRAYEEFADEPFATAESARLERLRLEAETERLECALRLGRAFDVVDDAICLAGEHPLDERIQAIAMVTLYRCRRAGEALRVFETTRHALAQEVGLEPGVELAELRGRILRHDPTLEWVGPRRAPLG
ncbi:MAG TPA: BTAD domain-containing putative transcriptional regulator [Actinomycetales bacterium]|nr:BTAD domain-containing putative transcriptional regulator [Actinomycetales bacterium]